MQTTIGIKRSRSLLSKSDSSTFHRKFKSMLDDFSRKYPYKPRRSRSYVDKMNKVIGELNNIPYSTLATVPLHQFYNTIQNLIRDLLIDWYSTYQLNPEETFLLRNCVYHLNRLVNIVDDVTVLTLWLLDPLLINALANCMSNIDQLLSNDKEKQNFKQLSHLLDLFITYYQRLPSNLQNTDDFQRLFEATMNCLVSSKYDQVFRKLKPKAKSMTTKEFFFLIKCPLFITSNHGIHSNRIIEQVLETMIPRYASILEKHIKSINKWNYPMMHAVHYLLLTVVIAKGKYTPYANGQPLQWLIDHIVQMISESSIVNKVNEHSSRPETILIDSALKTLTTFIHEPDLLVYLKQLKITSIFRSLILLPYESIIIHVYVMLAYTMDEKDIKESEKDSGRLLSNIFDSLRKEIKSISETSQNAEIIERNITLLIEAIRALVQHDQIKSEILKQNALSLLINNSQYFNDKSKRLILESVGSMTFDSEAARLLRENTKFMDSVENMQQTNDVGIKKAADKIIWNLVKEPEKVAGRKKVTPSVNTELDEKKEDTSNKDEYEYDFMISYCHADKELVYRIQEFLADKGFKIWFDRDNMYGPAMQAMADAVENSEFVILCMSDSYKRSVYCQAEAEYAFNCKRRLLPLIVRQEYRPDGWLGLLLGSRIYVDFGRFEFKKACELLLTETTLQKKSQLNGGQTSGHTLNGGAIDPIKSVSTDDTASSPLTAITTVKQSCLPNEYINRNTEQSTYHSNSINEWTRKDVLDFLFDLKLYLMMPLCESMNGYGFYKFFRMCHAEPSHFYGQLNEELRSQFNGLYLPIGIFTQFLSEIEQRTGLLPQTPMQGNKNEASQPKPASPSPVLSTTIKSVTDKSASPSPVPSTTVKSVTDKPASIPSVQSNAVLSTSTEKPKA